MTNDKKEADRRANPAAPIRILTKTGRAATRFPTKVSQPLVEPNRFRTGGENPKWCGAKRDSTRPRSFPSLVARLLGSQAAFADPKAAPSGGSGMPDAVLDCSHLSSRRAHTARPDADNSCPKKQSGRRPARRLGPRGPAPFGTTRLAPGLEPEALPSSGVALSTPDLSHWEIWSVVRCPLSEKTRSAVASRLHKNSSDDGQRTTDKSARRPRPVARLRRSGEG